MFLRGKQRVANRHNVVAATGVFFHSSTASTVYSPFGPLDIFAMSRLPRLPST